MNKKGRPVEFCTCVSGEPAGSSIHVYATLSVRGTMSKSVVSFVTELAERLNKDS
jgi:hypothetical protein